MYWRYTKGSSLAALVKSLLQIFRQLLVAFDGDVERALEYLDEIAQRYRLWRADFGLEDFKNERLALTQEAMLTRTTEEWIERLDAFDVPHAPVLTRREMIRHPQIVALPPGGRRTNWRLHRKKAHCIATSRVIPRTLIATSSQWV